VSRPDLTEVISHYSGIVGVHPAAELFPSMADDEYAALVADVQENGFSQPVVVTSDGLLLDGRNRLLVSWDVQLDVHIRRFDPSSPVQFVLSENLHRRHLNTGQRALVALDALPLYEAEAAQRMLAGRRQNPEADLPQGAAREPQARDHAAAAAGVSGRAVAQAKRIVEQAPDLVPAVKTGELALDAADKEAARRQQARDEDVPAPEPKPAPAPVLLTLRTHTGEEVPYPQPRGKATFNPTNEHISWAAWSWNPVTGCLHGCDYCYARELATKDSYAGAYPVGFTPLLHHERLDAPANTRVPDDAATDPRRGRVFVCSMADLYGRWVPQEWIDRVHAACIDNPQWEYLMLTKFPERYVGLKLPGTAWLGTSVDTQKRVRLAEQAFAQIPRDDVRVRWLSLEPLREPLRFNDLTMFDWVVIGSQTQTVQPTGVVPAFAPPFEWVARLVAQAREAGCRVYLKPNLRHAPGMRWLDEYPEC
jgi:protein gp37